MQKITIIIKAIKNWIIRRENKHLAQDLKIHEVEELIKLSIANGEKSISTWNITYLREYVKSRLIKPKDTKLLIMPLYEKRLKSLLAFSFLLRNTIRCEKEISSWTIPWPISWILDVISSIIFKIISKIWNIWIEFN